MRLLLLSALLTLTPALLMEAQARVETPCAAFGRICHCQWYVPGVSANLPSPATDRMHANPLGGWIVPKRSTMTIPTYLPYYVLIGSVAVTVAILFGLRSALANSDWPEPDRTVAFRWSAAVLIGWFLFSVALGLAVLTRRIC